MSSACLWAGSNFMGPASDRNHRRKKNSPNWENRQSKKSFAEILTVMPFGGAVSKLNKRQEQINENICRSAKENARFIKPLRDISERDDDGSEDAVVIQKRASGRYDIYYTTSPRPNDSWHMGGIPTRQSILAEYLNFVASKCTTNVSGFYRICWDDMNFDVNAKNCLVFSKYKDQQVALLPDVYQILDYKHAGLTKEEQQICHGVSDGITPFDQKKPMSVFAGK